MTPQNSLDVELWNYKTKDFDTLKQQVQYGKQDSFNAGKITPDNISPEGNIRIRLTAHNVAERNLEDKTGKAMVGTGGKQTGIAWFNYALVTPVPVLGRVNVNTAEPRLLASLPGINAELANNIANGFDFKGKKSLKPYQRLGDLFAVKGMTPGVFEKCANLLALDSSAFTIEVEAQILKNQPQKAQAGINNNDKFAPDLVDNIIATRKKRFVVEVDKKTDEHLKITELERYPVR